MQLKNRNLLFSVMRVIHPLFGFFMLHSACMDLSLSVLIFLFFIGLAVGSFLNVLIFRIPEGEGVVSGRSHCRKCAKTLSWFELIPLFSYIFLRGRCLVCREHISIQYPLVELISGFNFVLVFWWANVNYGITPFSFLTISYVLFVFSVLFVVFVTDLRHFIIPDRIVYPAITVTLILILLNRFAFACKFPTVSCGLTNVALSLVGALFFLTLVLVSRGRWMGLGDVKLAVLMGLFLGFGKLIVALLLSFFGGSVIGALLMLLRKKTLKDEVPFGTFLLPDPKNLRALFSDGLWQAWR